MDEKMKWLGEQIEKTKKSIEENKKCIEILSEKFEKYTNKDELDIAIKDIKKMIGNLEIVEDILKREAVSNRRDQFTKLIIRSKNEIATVKEHIEIWRENLLRVAR